MSKADELITRALELDAAATPGPWMESPHTKGDPGEGPTMFRVYQEVANVAFLFEYSRGAEIDASLIAEYRTLAPVLARMLQRALGELRSVAVSSSWRIRQDASDAIEEIEAMAQGGETK